MRIIDGQGRIFKKINIIDATIIILLLAAIGIWAVLIQKTVSVEDTYKREIITVKGRCNNIPVQIYKLIKKGDRASDSEFGFHAVVEKVEKIGNIREVKRSDGITEGNVDIMIWLKMKVYVDKKLMLYHYNRMTPGTTFSFQTKKYAPQSVVVLEIIRSNEE